MAGQQRGIKSNVSKDKTALRRFMKGGVGGGKEQRRGEQEKTQSKKGAAGRDNAKVVLT